MNLFVHTRAGNAVPRPLRGWSRFLATGALCLGLAACGGGGGGGDTASTQPASGLVVTVTDTYDAAIAGATVVAAIGSSTLTGTTGADGRAVLAGADGNASVTVSRDPFFFPKTVPATITAGAVTQLTVKLERATSAAGGSLTSRSGVLPIADTPTSLTFEIELVIVDSHSQPIENLTGDNFVLRTCAPDPNSERADCVRGSVASFDTAYTPSTGTPQNWELVENINPAEPYAAALMLDQSGSINVSDPTGARLYSAKAFLEGLGSGDWVLLSAFANGDGAKIPTIPLKVYEQFKDSASATSYFSTLDSLTDQVGGNTPLYEALDLLRERVVSDVNDVTINPTGIAKALVIFTDGDDTGPECDIGPVECRVRRQESIDAAMLDQVRIFTIGLSNNVDFEALGELANKTGGAFLFAENAQQLIPLYGSVGRLLSLSLPTYRLTWTVQADSALAFESKNALIGKVDVTTADGTFVVPFIVGIP